MVAESQVIDEVYMVTARLMGEEEFREIPYDDATGLPVKAPVGNATIGYGCKLVWSSDLAHKVLLLQVEETQDELLIYEWYTKCNTVRRSVLLDVGFNDGVKGLSTFHLMIAAILVNNWAEAARQCHVKNVKLAKRYAVLANLFLTGGIAS